MYVVKLNYVNYLSISLQTQSHLIIITLIFILVKAVFQNSQILRKKFSLHYFLLIEHTFIMRLTNFFTYLLSFFFFALPMCGCRKMYYGAQNSMQENSSSTLESPDYAETESSPNSPPAPILPAENTPFWNMDDVDVSRISPTRKLIAFSFDDAPSRTLENIIAVYAAFNESNPDCPAYATVFCNSGRFDAQTPHLLTTCLAMGMELGNHTHSHFDLTTLNEADLLDEINKTDELLYEIDGKTRHLLRAPFGKANDFVEETAPTPLINWTIDTLDWSGVSEDAIYRAVYENRFSGAIVLMHDGYRHTVDALKRLLPDLKADGYQVVSVSQLAKAHGCTLRRGSTYIRARKQN